MVFSPLWISLHGSPGESIQPTAAHAHTVMQWPWQIAVNAFQGVSHSHRLHLEKHPLNARQRLCSWLLPVGLWHHRSYFPGYVHLLTFSLVLNWKRVVLQYRGCEVLHGDALALYFWYQETSFHVLISHSLLLGGCTVVYLVGFPIDSFAFILLLFRSFMFWVLLCCQLTGPPNRL